MLFIGGKADGRFLNSPNVPEYSFMHPYEKYTRMQFAGNSKTFSVMVLDGIDADSALERLIGNYYPVNNRKEHL